MKTARFTDLVKQAGAPKSYLLWVPPKQDPVFQRALKDQRILTIHQENVGTKKDYGMVGFHEGPTAQYLVFPKPLKGFLDRRVIGINYDLLAQETQPAKGSAIASKKGSKDRSVSKGQQVAAPEAAANKQRDVSAAKIVAFEPVDKKPEPEKDSPPQPPSPKKSATPERPKKIGKRENVKKPEKPVKPVKPMKPEKPVKSEAPKKEEKPVQPIEPENAQQTEAPSTNSSHAESHLLDVVRRAMKDLDAGKTVAAYKKLEALIDEAEKRAKD
jgi:hypothetical protein